MIPGNANPITCAGCGVLFKNQPTYAAHAKGSRKCTSLMRFWGKVDKGEGCWLWTGRTDASGYGRLDRKGPNVYVHRVAWTLTNGPVPEGMDVLHTCDVRNCCNPAHLWLGTHEQNMADCKAKRRTTWGARSGQAKLTEEQAKEILALYKRDGPRKSNALELAGRYKVGRGTILALVRGHSWAHLNVTEPQPGKDK